MTDQLRTPDRTCSVCGVPSDWPKNQHGKLAHRRSPLRSELEARADAVRAMPALFAYEELVRDLLAALAALAAQPSPSEGLREAAEALLQATEAERTGGQRYAFENELTALRVFAQPSPSEPKCEDCGHPPDHHLGEFGCYCGCMERFAGTSPSPSEGPLGAINALPRLRLTGEQLEAIDPDPEKQFFVDWDEYDEYVRLNSVRAALGDSDA